jgi:hypothetical protein
MKNSARNNESGRLLNISLQGPALLAALALLAPGAQAGVDWGWDFGGGGFGWNGGSNNDLPTVSTLIDEEAGTSFSRNYGSGNATGQASLTASASVEVHDSDDSLIPVGRARADVLGLARITLLGHTIEAARLELNGLVESHDFQLNSNGTDMLSIDERARFDAGVTARVAGVTLLNNDWGNSVNYNPATAVSDELGLAGSIPLASTGTLQRNLFSFTHHFAIGPVPVSVSASAGAGVQLGSSLNYDALAMEVELEGDASAYANGQISGAIDLFVASVGIMARADFANTGAALSVEADSDGLHGGFTASMTPIELRLSGFASVGYGYWSYFYYVSLFYWTSGSVQYQREL